jgi:rhodanese-related sulfurtransferase
MKRQRIIVIILANIISISMASCQSDYDKKLRSLYRNTVPLITADSIVEELQDRGDIVLLDTRSAEEYAVSHIAEARFIDYKKFRAQDVADIPKDARVVVYCSVGYRSERIGEKLLKMGFEDVSNLYGGIFQWKNEDRQVVNLQKQPTDSVHTYNRRWSRWLQNGIKIY